MIGSFVRKHRALVALVGVLGAHACRLRRQRIHSGRKGTQTPATVGNAGLLRAGVFQWGNDSTGGMPYIVPKDDNNKTGDYYGFEVDIANAMAKLMNVQSAPDADHLVRLATGPRRAAVRRLHERAGDDGRERRSPPSSPSPTPSTPSPSS